MKSRNLPKLILVSLFASVSALHAADHVVDQKDKTFSAATLTIKPGDRIVFKNSDTVAHNMFSTSLQNAFSIAIQKPGESTPVVFNDGGVTEIRCAIHPKMKIVVTVAK